MERGSVTRRLIEAGGASRSACCPGPTGPWCVASSSRSRRRGAGPGGRGRPMQGEAVHEVAGGLPCLAAAVVVGLRGAPTSSVWDADVPRRRGQPCAGRRGGGRRRRESAAGAAGWPGRGPGSSHGGHPDELRGLSRGRPGAPAEPRLGRSQRRPAAAGRSGGRVCRPRWTARRRPSMAKSMKSAWACSLNRSPVRSLDGGRPRLRTASALARNRSTMACGIELIGHEPDGTGAAGAPRMGTPRTTLDAIGDRWSPR